MTRITVRPFEPRDLDDAARLLAARHTRDRQRLPMLAAALEERAACRSMLAPLVENPRAEGAIATRGDQVVGFLFGEQSLIAPDNFAYQFVPPYAIAIGVQHHAVAVGEDATTVYRALYAHLAEGWTRKGFFEHRAHVVPGDAEVQEAWVALGFGRHMTAATRSTEDPVRNTRAAGIEVHDASPEDIDVVMGLSLTLARHHAQAPMFWPVLPTALPAAREFMLGALADPSCPHFIGYRDGKPIGMQTFLVEGFTPPIVERDGNIYLFEGVVEPEAQSAGVGAALLDHGMRWARDSGYRWCTLHFASGNPSGAPFWLSHGFIPVEHAMVRRIDERIAWARE
ncbi:MAG: GNAT family N-acetyltransferase [Dehalococcoidia bacterium]